LSVYLFLFNQEIFILSILGYCLLYFEYEPIWIKKFTLTSIVYTIYKESTWI